MPLITEVSVNVAFMATSDIREQRIVSDTDMIFYVATILGGNPTISCLTG